ncbi:DUF6994 family protein [Nesterenkonia suensis]
MEYSLDAIDVEFDVRSDTPPGKDPDSHSPTLRRYHQILWSKPLPNGDPFTLSTARRYAYLHHESHRGSFVLASDRITQGRSWRPAEAEEYFTAEQAEAFRALANSVAGVMIWPGNRIERKMTINGARGFTRKIADRMDLTLECVRRHYRSEHSPLTQTLARYSDFFDLFETFDGFVDFFHFQDLLTDTGEDVAFFTDFDDFRSSGKVTDPEAYPAFHRRNEQFLQARRERIRASLRHQ